MEVALLVERVPSEYRYEVSALAPAMRQRAVRAVSSVLWMPWRWIMGGMGRFAGC
jgi:hypothetical protein